MGVAPIFISAFLLNFLWEVWHAQLYTTCRKMRLPELVRLLTWQSVKDAVWITVAYLLAPNIYVFVLGLLLFSYLVELHAVTTKRWEYAPQMPVVFSVGLFPFIELAVTGLMVVFFVRHILLV